MATSNSQRIGIWIIAVVMVVGTIGSFFIVVVANQNQQTDQQKAVELQEEYQKQIEEYQKKSEEQAKQLSNKYYEQFAPYEKQVKKFNSKSVKKLATVDLKKGDGATVGEGTEYGAYYIGWLPSGKVFDSSIDGKSLKTPITSDVQLIEGWTKGLQGMKVGGVREISIPAAQAYGEQGSGEIEPNTPIKFVVMLFPKPAQISPPQFPNQ